VYAILQVRSDVPTIFFFARRMMRS